MASSSNSAKDKKARLQASHSTGTSTMRHIRPDDDEALVFEGLTDASWISRPLKVWIEASGIKKHITFHCGRHSYASLLLENGVDIYTIKSLMGHTNVKTTQIYTHIVNEQKEKAANTLHIENLDL